MSYYIYRMTHTPTGRTYIGQRKMPKGCLCPYLDKYNGSGVVWRQIFKAHPGECSKEVLAVAVSKADIDNLEIRYIAEERAINPEGCVNIANGGDCGPVMCGEDNPNFGKHLSEETKRKMSEAKRGEKHHFFGKHLSEETRRKMSEARKGENNPLFGKHFSEESKRKMSEAKRGKHHSDETKRKMSESLKGRQFSDETRRKISEAKRAYWARKKALTVNN